MTVLSTPRVGRLGLAVAALCATLLGAATGCGSRPAQVASPAHSTAAPAPEPSVAASPTPSPSPVAPPLSVPRGVSAGVVVFDRQTASFTEQYQQAKRFRSASVVKLLIALDFFWNRGPGYAVPTGDRGRLDVMLRSSDDAAATYYWKLGGNAAIVDRMVSRLRLQDTAPPPTEKPGYWGYTAVSAGDLVRIYQYLLDKAPAPVREYVLGNLRQSTRCGTDRYDQSFGIPTAFARPWAVKQGWSGFGTAPAIPCVAPAAAWVGDPPLTLTAPAPDLVAASSTPVPSGLFAGGVLHTTGVVGAGDRWIVAVLTQHPPGTPFSTATAALNQLTRSLPLPGAQRSH